MDNNKVIIYTLIILLIAAVVFNPAITGEAFKFLPTKTAVSTTKVLPTPIVSNIVLKSSGNKISLTTTQKFSGKILLTDDQCIAACGGVYSSSGDWCYDECSLAGYKGSALDSCLSVCYNKPVI